MQDNTGRRTTSLGYKISRLFRLNGCILDSWLNEHGICSGQIPYIMTTVEREGQTQDQLSASIRVCPAATARMLKSMESSCLVRREENPNNRRQKFVYPTNKAKQLYATLIPLLDRHNQVMLKGFSKDEKTLAKSMLDRIYANVQNELKEVKK